MSFLEKYAVPLAVSVTLHIIVIVAMLKGWAPDIKKMEIKRPNYVQAQLVKLEDTSKQTKKAVNKPNIVDLTKKRQEQERQKKLAEQKKQRELQRKQEAEQKKRADAEKQKLEQERKAKETARQKAEAERKKQEQVKRQKELEAFDDALAQENQQLLEESYAVAAQSFISVISQRVEQNWNRPPSARNGMQCELLIQLVPTGLVINVDIVKSSGSDQFDRSAVQAVKKAEQFPEIKTMKPEVFERYYRELKLVFRPQDLRQ